MIFADTISDKTENIDEDEHVHTHNNMPCVCVFKDHKVFNMLDDEIESVTVGNDLLVLFGATEIQIYVVKSFFVLTC